MSDQEREIMTRHAAHWRPYIESGQMVFFGPVLDGSGSWGLGVAEVDDEEDLRAFATADPVVTTGTGTIEVGTSWVVSCDRGRTASRYGTSSVSASGRLPCAPEPEFSSEQPLAEDLVLSDWRHAQRLYPW